MLSKLQKNPKSKILKRGYINIYSRLSRQEERQVYFKTFYKNENSVWDESMVHLSRKLKSFLSGKEVLLDIGCGNGNYLVDENRKLISWAIGIDEDKNAVKNNICLDKIVIGDIKNMSLKENSFDIVMGLWVIEHLSEPKKSFKQIHKVLKKGGKFLFVTSNYNFFPLRLLRIISNPKMNYYLNSWLFGRSKRDIFKTYYKANTIAKLNEIIKSDFKIIELRTNYDPSYTSFDILTYKLSNLINRFFTRLNLDVTHPHIVGVLEAR